MPWEDESFQDMSAFFNASEVFWNSTDTDPVEPFIDPFKGDEWKDDVQADPETLLEETLKEDGHLEDD